VESKIFITHDIKCAVNASTAGKGDCDCGAVEQAEKQEPRKEWVGLTDEEIALYEKRLSGSGVARDIEAKLKEKNT
jgi:hypothetical protein